MKTKMKKVFGIMLSLAMVLGLLPGMILTAYAQTVNIGNVSQDTTLNNGDVLSGQNSNLKKKIKIAAGAEITLDNVTLWQYGEYPGIECLGDATIILKSGTTNTVKATKRGYPGIFVPSGKTLTIKGTGTLNVNGGSNGAGIGAGSYEGNSTYQNCGNIVIENGTINATGMNFAAGIGLCGNSPGTCGNITITGGTVTATAEAGTGIGTGSSDRSQQCGNILIVTIDTLPTPKSH